ncbi:MAG: Fe-S cluster assembly protein SufD [Halothiobacillaceae bacterium]
MSGTAMIPADSPWQQRFAALDVARGPFADLRRRAWAEFTEHGFPDPREEEWRWTNVRPIARKDFESAPVSDVAAVDAAQVLALAPALDDGPRLTLVDGLFHAGASDCSKLPEGVRLRPLSAVLAEDPGAVTNLLGQQADGALSRFVSMNTALMRDGLVLEIADGVRVEQPVTLLHAIGLSGTGIAAQPRLLVRLGRHAEVTLVERLVSQPDSGSFHNAVAEIELGDNARLNHVLLGEAGPDAFSVWAVWGRMARDARYRNFNLQFGSRLTRVDLNIEVAQPGAHCDLIGLQMPTGRQHMDTHTRLNHAAAHTTSHEHYRSIADDHGRAVFKGRILVARDAQKIEAYQSSANLLLSDQAEVDAKPELEIYADDVKCSHGATIGQLDEEALYYLQSRGMPRTQAREMLIFGFAEEITNQLELPALRAHLTRRVAGELASTLLEDL